MYIAVHAYTNKLKSCSQIAHNKSIIFSGTVCTISLLSKISTFVEEELCKSRVGNLFVVAGHKQTKKVSAGRNKFSQTIWFLKWGIFGILMLWRFDVFYLNVDSVTLFLLIKLQYNKA